jgi:TRAP transporter TAXI family solute receptor
MTNSRLMSAILPVIAVLLITGLQAFAQTQPPGRATVASRLEEKRRQTNNIAVAIMTSGMTCTCARFAEDIRNVVNDLRPGGLRVLPILGVGGLQNLNDVLFLNNMDMGIVDQDNIVLAKKRDPQLYAGTEKRIQFITKLYNSELHILARQEIKTFADLKGKKVNFNLKDSQTDVTADRVFNMLNLQVERLYYDVDTAIGKLLKGEIDAAMMLSGAPHSTTAKLKREDGVHFLSLDDASMPGYSLAPVFAEYLPGELTHDVYPNLIREGAPVQTIVNRALLVTYAWPENTAQYRKVEHFVTEFFNKIDCFKGSGRHPKWREINLWADMPGWTRFKPAAEWLAAHRTAAGGAAPPSCPGSVSSPAVAGTRQAAEPSGTTKKIP